MLINRESFYTIEPKQIQVSENDFNKYIYDYPRILKSHIVKLPQSSTTYYYDEELCDRFPYGVMAKVATDLGKPNRYFIVENYEECFNSKRKEV